MPRSEHRHERQSADGAPAARGAGVIDRLRVVIAEDSVLLREGIVRLLELAGFEVVGQAGDGEDLLRKVGAHRPDVAVIDVRMPPRGVNAATIFIRRGRHAATRSSRMKFVTCS